MVNKNKSIEEKIDLVSYFYLVEEWSFSLSMRKAGFVSNWVMNKEITENEKLKKLRDMNRELYFKKMRRKIDNY